MGNSLETLHHHIAEKRFHKALKEIKKSENFVGELFSVFPRTMKVNAKDFGDYLAQHGEKKLAFELWKHGECENRVFQATVNGYGTPKNVKACFPSWEQHSSLTFYEMSLLYEDGRVEPDLKKSEGWLRRAVDAYDSTDDNFDMLGRDWAWEMMCKYAKVETDVIILVKALSKYAVEDSRAREILKSERFEEAIQKNLEGVTDDIKVYRLRELAEGYPKAAEMLANHFHGLGTRDGDLKARYWRAKAGGETGETSEPSAPKEREEGEVY